MRSRLRTSIDVSHATPSADVRAGSPRDFEPTETTHYSVVDADGNAVSTTTTLNGGFGNAETVAGAGFLLNNEMDDFSARPNSPNTFGLLGGEANAVAPGKRMLSSMTPTIVTRDGRTVLVLGSPGGSQIITTVLQVLLDVVDFKMNVQEAVDAPRFHHQWSAGRRDDREGSLRPRRAERARRARPQPPRWPSRWARCTRSPSTWLQANARARRIRARTE